LKTAHSTRQNAGQDVRRGLSLATTGRHSAHVYEVRPRKDKRGFDLISDALPFGALWYGEPNAISNAVNYARFYSRSHDAVIRVYDEAGSVIDTYEQTGQFKEW
jgi:hypothetical protein